MKPLVNYFAASRAELAKVTWPGRRQIVRLTIIVVIFSLVFAALLGAIDFVFTTVIQQVIIKG